MSNTVSGNKDDPEYKEYVDSEKLVIRKVKELAELIRKHSGKVVVYTGAGISTGAGIPDFRSGLHSVTGMPAGKWCQDATREQWTDKEREEETKRRNATVSTLNAIPTKSHMALVALQQAGILKGLISQNCDGLHRRSGFPSQHLAELHGNSNLEYCPWCGKEYLRDFRASTGRHTVGKDLKAKYWVQHEKLPLINPRRGNHYTGRRCLAEGCQGWLFDSTIDFGDSLPEVHIDRGYELAKRAGMCIVLGSRCSVSPACDMPISVGQSKRPLVVVNLQRTAADDYACLRIGSKIDDVMVPLMQELGLVIPEFTLQRMIRVTRKDDFNIELNAIEPDGTPTDLLWNAQARFRLTKGTPCSDPPLQPVTLVMNQDAKSNNNDLPQPGHMAILEEWPWANQHRPGSASVRMTSGGCKGKAYTVSADICDGVDEVKRVVDDLVVDAGKCHGATLTHIISVPASVKSECYRLMLMFRAHYAERPLSLPPPAANSSVLYQLVYFPSRGVWAEPKILESNTDGDVMEDDAKQSASSTSAPVVVHASEVDSEMESKPSPDGPLRPVFLHIKAQESNEGGKYRCWHELSLSEDSVNAQNPTQIASVKLSTPNQGFRQPERILTESPFLFKFGPCWGRPHVTIDITTKTGAILSSVFEDNLPRSSTVIALVSSSR